MKRDSEVKRYGKVVVFQHWLAIVLVFTSIFTGLLLARDWFIHEFHIYGAEMYVPTPDFASSLHEFAALGIVVLGFIHLAFHAGQKEKPILPRNSINELRAALHSLLYLVFLAKRMERGSGDKYYKTQRIIYAFTVYVLGLAAITGFLFYADILAEQMLIAHVMAGALVILVGIHRAALVIRRHDKVALRSVLATGTMPRWYVRKYHKVWYEKISGEGDTDSGMQNRHKS